MIADRPEASGEVIDVDKNADGLAIPREPALPKLVCQMPNGRYEKQADERALARPRETALSTSQMRVGSKRPTHQRHSFMRVNLNSIKP